MNLASYFLAFALPGCISYLLTPMLIHLAFKFNFLDYPTDRKRHAKPIPYLGGIAIFTAFWIAIALSFTLRHSADAQLNHLLELPYIFSNVKPWAPKIGGVFFGGIFVLILGFLDDKFNLSPIIKFIGQGIAAIILLKIGLQVNLLQQLGSIGYGVTFIWIVLLMNAFNFIDSIDGHCAGIALISTFVFFFMTQIIQQEAVALLILAFAGALAGFFPFNFRPAKCFLGDSGSLFIGYMMSVITLLCRYHTTGHTKLTPFIPILMFGVPIYDTVSVIIVRLFRGMAPWKGDRNHLAHRLVRLGMGEKTAALASYFIAITLGLVALLSTQVYTRLGNFLILMIFGCIISIIALLEYYAALRIRLMEKMAAAHRRRREDIQKAEDQG